MKESNHSAKSEESQDIDFDMGYNAFLSSILNPLGLEHGYNTFDGFFIAHRIFKKDSMKKRPLLKRILGEKFVVETVAQLSEKQFDGSNSGEAKIEVIDRKYDTQLREILHKIHAYDRRRAQGVSYTDNSPLILSRLLF